MSWIFSWEEEALLGAPGGDEEGAVARAGEALLAACEAGWEGRQAVLDALERGLASARLRPRLLQVAAWLRAHTAALPHGAPLRLVRVPIETSSVREYLDLIIVPSVFDPEDWGMTFLEGLLRRPAGSALRVAELGTGTGWISLALLLATDAAQIVGYDLNPVAVQVSRLNALLNSYDALGRPRLGPEGSRGLLHERFQSAQSDLLKAALEQGESFDLIVGCIPQVLAPNPDLDPHRALREHDDSGLYDLSNYFVLQGVYEDQFGLGLLASALDQSVRALRPGGRVILNIAGRPGTAVIEAMFTRRGFLPQVIWRRRVRQAADTDIGVLASLEARTGNPFAFYMDRASREPIGAATAHALLQAGRPVWHDVRVYEAGLRFEREMRGFLQVVRELGGADLLAQLDLSQISEEQLGYLGALAERFREAPVAPYTEEEGSARLRAQVASYLRRFFGLPQRSCDVFLGPRRQEVLRALASSLTEPGQAALVSANLAPVYAVALEKAGLGLLRGHNDLDELTALVEALRPALVVVAPDPDDRRNFAGMRRLLEVCQRQRAVLVLEGSQDFEITSNLHRNPLLDLLAAQGHPPGVFVLIGLIKNRVYPALQPALLLGATSPLREALVAFAEATWSRNDTFAEHYYEHLFQELLSFQLSTPIEPVAAEVAPEGEPPLSRRALALLTLPAFQPSPQPWPGAGAPIRLDYGENELPIPDRLMKGLLLGFTELGAPGQHAREAIAGFCAATMNWPNHPDRLTLGAGVFPLLADAALTLRRLAGRPLTVALPTGHYGYLPPIFVQAGCEVVFGQTDPADHFLWTPAALDDLEARGHRVDILFLNHPSNPAGVLYPRARLAALAQWLEPRDTWVLSDEIFSLLDLGPEGGEVYNLLHAASPEGRLRKRILSFSGISKAFAAGGARLGWVYGEDEAVVSAMRALRSDEPSPHALIAAEALLRGFRGGNAADEGAAEVLSYLRQSRAALRERRDALVGVLAEAGITVPAGRPGGLFVFADFSPWEGRRWRAPDGELRRLEAARVDEALLLGAGLRVNPGSWAGAPGFARLCFSLRRVRFELALRSLRRFCAQLA